ncbi:MAG: AMP-binding protein, partial [Bacteroidia bacterium]|nr:AMP-binding protein [Bacteroidia bacterium]
MSTSVSDPVLSSVAPAAAAPSAQVDRFVHDRLPAPAQLPRMAYPLPELRIGAQANLVQTLFAKAFREGRADKPMLRSDKITLTYADALERVNRIAQVLTEDFKLQPGNRVLLRGGNSIGMALAWLGVVQAGLVAVATMPLLRAKELGEVIEKARPALALCDASLLQELQTAKAQSDTLPVIVPFNLMDEPGSLAVLSAQKDGKFTPCPVAADDIALMAFTSGTTGKPKAAVHTHRDVLAACEAWPRHVLKARPDDIVVGSPPLAFTFGLGGMLIFPMWAGASVYYPSIGYTPEAMV